MSDDIESGAERAARTVEKRAARIQRWLRRCAAACRSSAWSSALMEIECAEAETKGMREDLWEAAAADAEGKRPAAPRRPSLIAARACALALVLLLALNIPLSTEQDRRQSFAEPMSIELLTSSESEMLETLRRTLSVSNAGRVVVEIEVPEPVRDVIPAASAAEVSPPQTAQPRPSRAASIKAVPASPATATSPRTEQSAPSAETLISLMQIGEGALRPNRGITVIK